MEGKDAKNSQDILSLLEDIWLLDNVNDIRCVILWTFKETEWQTKQATTEESHIEAKVLVAPLVKLPRYSETDLKWARLEGTKDKNEWEVLPRGKVFLLETLRHFMIQDLHVHMCLGKTDMAEFLGCTLFVPRL